MTTSFSPFQRAADVVDLRGIQQHDGVVVVEEKFLQGFAKPAQIEEGGEGRLGFGRRVVLRLGELGLRLEVPLGCPLVPLNRWPSPLGRP